MGSLWYFTYMHTWEICGIYMLEKSVVFYIHGKKFVVFWVEKFTFLS